MLSRTRIASVAARFAAGVLVATVEMGTAGSQELEKFIGVTAQGGPTAQMFPVFMAMEKGFYAEEGLDVELNYSKGSSDAARQLAAGNVDWGIFSSAATMQTVQRGFPLKAIMQIYYPDTFDVVVPADSPVQTMKDMAGKTIGVSDLAGGEVPMTRASIVESGLKEGSDVKMVIAGEGDPTTIRSFQEDRIQAYAGAKRDLLLIPAQGIQTRSITPDAIAAFPGDALSWASDQAARCAKREKGREKAGGWTATRAESRWGCFLPDLTRLASGTSAANLPAAYITTCVGRRKARPAKGGVAPPGARRTAPALPEAYLPERDQKPMRRPRPSTPRRASMVRSSSVRSTVFSAPR